MKSFNFHSPFYGKHVSHLKFRLKYKIYPWEKSCKAFSAKQVFFHCHTKLPLGTKLLFLVEKALKFKSVSTSWRWRIPFWSFFVSKTGLLDSKWNCFETGFSNSGGIILMAIGSKRRDWWELTPLKAGASPSLLSGREPIRRLKLEPRH